MNVATESLRGGSRDAPRDEGTDSLRAVRAEGFAIETVVEKSGVNVLIPALKDRGASDIIELALSKIVH